ncbi:MAG: hypothetical protein EXQ96_10600 [Alphaproteobacteria bacterium]|nr:hypothetical protein [Alphaproteobacteria bacterium]
MPYHFVHWTTVVAALESRAIALGGAYLEARAQIDPLFAHFFIRHAHDELRHREFDDLIARWLLSGQSRWAAWIDAKAIELSFASSFHEDASASLAVIRLVADFPALRPHEPLLIAQATAGQSGAFVHHLLDAEHAPFTHLAADRRAILRQAIRYQSGGSVQ